MEQIIHFQNDKIVAAIIEGKPYIAIRPICQNLGLDPDNALELIKKDEILGDFLVFHPVQVSKIDENLPPEHGVQPVQVSDFEEKTDLNTVKTQTRQMGLLPLEYIHGWLFQVKISNTMKPETKEKLKKYKKEVYKILYEHFFGSKMKMTHNVSQKNQLLAEKEALQAEEKFVKGRIKEIDAKLSQIDLDNQSLERQRHRQLELAF